MSSTQGGQGLGNVEVVGLPACYNCGQVYNLKVRINDADATRQVWGFEIGAQYKDSDATFDVRGAGVLDNAAGARTQVRVTDGSDTGVRRFVTHDSESANGNGTYPGPNNNGFVEWDVKWTAPACNERNTNVRFYVAGLAGNDNGGVSGDRTYTRTYDVPPCVVHTENPSWGGLKKTYGTR
jgi:hypothetical protein